MAFEKITEKPSLYNDLEKKTVADILEEINTEDHKIADAVQDILPSITEFVNKALPRIAKGGRLFYLGLVSWTHQRFLQHLGCLRQLLLVS